MSDQLFPFFGIAIFVFVFSMFIYLNVYIFT